VSPEDLAAVADVVVQAIQDALAPVLERLAVVEARLVDLNGGEAALGLLRERVAVVETKAAIPVADRPAVDLTPVLERLAAVDARLETLGDLRDRVVAVETKGASPVPPVDLGDVRDRLAAVEQRTPTRELWDALQGTIGELRAGVKALETRGPDEAATRELGALRERVAVVETRAPVPGPAGKDGLHGKDGADGLGFEDLAVDFNGDRTLSVKFTRGDLVKVFPIVLPFLKYQGVFQDGKAYDAGDVVTWAGSTWHCKTATSTKPGDTAADWTLIVKRGRDGKDAAEPDARTITALVSKELMAQIRQGKQL
jgi:hypothetical protein